LSKHYLVIRLELFFKSLESKENIKDITLAGDI